MSDLAEHLSISSRLFLSGLMTIFRHRRITALSISTETKENRYSFDHQYIAIHDSRVTFWSSVLPTVVHLDLISQLICDTASKGWTGHTVSSLLVWQLRSILMTILTTSPGAELIPNVPLEQIFTAKSNAELITRSIATSPSWACGPHHKTSILKSSGPVADLTTRTAAKLTVKTAAEKSTGIVGDDKFHN